MSCKENVVQIQSFGKEYFVWDAKGENCSIHVCVSKRFYSTKYGYVKIRTNQLWYKSYR